MTTQNEGVWPPPDAAPPPGLHDLSGVEIDKVSTPAAAPSQPLGASMPVARSAAPSPPASASSAPVVVLAPLRWSLMIDSLFLVPAYTAALVVALALLARTDWRTRGLGARWGPMARREWVLHGLCIAPIFAASFDIAENGILMRACEDAVSYVVTDGIVRDRALATLWKWALLGVSSGLVAWLGVLAMGTADMSRERSRWIPVPFMAALVARAAAAERGWPRRTMLRVAVAAGGLAVLAAAIVVLLLYRAIESRSDPVEAAVLFQAVELLALGLQLLAVSLAME
jgi:hypothetical protein